MMSSDRAYKRRWVAVLCATCNKRRTHDFYTCKMRAKWECVVCSVNPQGNAIPKTSSPTVTSTTTSRPALPSSSPATRCLNFNVPGVHTAKWVFNLNTLVSVQCESCLQTSIEPLRHMQKSGRWKCELCSLECVQSSSTTTSP